MWERAREVPQRAVREEQREEVEARWLFQGQAQSAPMPQMQLLRVLAFAALLSGALPALFRERLQVSPTLPDPKVFACAAPPLLSFTIDK